MQYTTTPASQAAGAFECKDEHVILLTWRSIGVWCCDEQCRGKVRNTGLRAALKSFRGTKYRALKGHDAKLKVMRTEIDRVTYTAKPKAAKAFEPGMN